MSVERHTVDPRGAQVAAHMAEMVNQVGRALSAMQDGNWASLRTRLEQVRFHATVADMEMNGDRYPTSTGQTEAAVKAGLEAHWSKVITDFLGDGRVLNDEECRAAEAAS